MVTSSEHSLHSLQDMRMTKMHDVLPINQYHTDLQKEIDDAEWLGEFERADSAKDELEHIKRMIDNGELWYPTF